jgi:sugar transferase (PEP-CTERM/EpsH1 system associated)
MQNLLFLTHRIPYPPNKGDKIRSYHVLKYLAQHYRVHLGTFIDDPDDWQHVGTVKKLCGDTHFSALNPLRAKLRSLKALAINQALTLDYYQNQGMHQWVARVIKQHAIKRVLVFSSAMAQYAMGHQQAQRIIDFVDIDYDKWQQYAQKKQWPMSWLYRRESRLLLDYERHVAQAFNASLFVSQAEADLFKLLAPESREKTGFFSNGVDTDYFSPARPYPNPYPLNVAAIVFTGAMDYWPNVDAVAWFAQQILPAVLAQHPQARFYIVGSRPTSRVMSLAALPGVYVTGSVPDVRPYLAHAHIAVAPLRIARGIQNKVLEAMSMAKTVLVSAQALEGIDAAPERELILAENAADFIAAVSAAMSHHDPAMGQHARQKIVNSYGWDSNLACIDALFEASMQAKESI